MFFKPGLNVLDIEKDKLGEPMVVSISTIIYALLRFPPKVCFRLAKPVYLIKVYRFSRRLCSVPLIRTIMHLQLHRLRTVSMF